MVDRPDAGELENLRQFTRNLGISRSTVFRRLKEGDPDFPQPIQQKPRSKLQWLTRDRLEYVQLLARRARAKLARRGPASSEDRPAA